jgi:hypothetical protein
MVREKLMLIICIASAVFLTSIMFVTKNMLLGFPSLIFWAIAGADALTMSSATWDMYYILFFACMGMAIFSAFAMYTLRLKDIDPGRNDYDDADPMMDEGKDQMMDDLPRESSQYIDEGKDDFGSSQPSRRVRDLRRRAAARRSGNPPKKKIEWGKY